jgi:hypothetical protein
MGATWGINYRVNDDVATTSQSNPVIETDGAGNTYALWEDARNGNPDIYFAYRSSEGTWGANVKVNDDAGTAMQYMPALAVDESGNAYALWADWRNGDPDIYFAYRPAGGNWQTNVRLNDDPGTEAQLHPDIVVDTGSNLYVSCPSQTFTL